jgi:DNA sulfur modification protein DndD
MRIKSIELNNFRLYKGKNIVSFPKKDNKNLFLIFGENGFGKTTFLHALTWCLYGRLMADVDKMFNREISGGKYSQVLNNNLNTSQKTQLSTIVPPSVQETIRQEGYSCQTDYVKAFSQYSVSLEFTDIFIPMIFCDTLKITRSYDVILEKESVEILIDDFANELTNVVGNEIFINDFILSKDLARFFFFDSEKIVSISESGTLEEKRQLCSAYNQVLGINKYEELSKNLESLRLRFRRKSTDIKERCRLEELLEKKRDVDAQLISQKVQIEILDVELASLRVEDGKLQLQLLREGSETLEELQRQKNVLLATEKRDEDYKQRLKLFLEYAPFAISGKVLRQTKMQMERDFELSLSQSNLRSMNYLLGNIQIEMKGLAETLSITEANKRLLVESFEKIIAKYQSLPTNETPLLNISKDELEEFLTIYTVVTSNYRMEFEYLAVDYRKNKQSMHNAARKIANMQNNESDELIKNIRDNKNEVEQYIAKLEQKIKSCHEKRGEINRELSVINRKISELEKRICVNDSDLKKDNLAKQLIIKLDTFLVLLKNERKFSLEKRIRDIFSQLTHKTNFIDSVEVVVNGDTLDIRLYAVNGEVIQQNSLSKGEQQLYATSLLKAFVEESEIQFPVFVDSPLQKFDRTHASKIITEFYPTISKQVVLFPLLHKELTIFELETMKPYVNTVYTIRNETSCSYIQPINIDDLIKF